MPAGRVTNDPSNYYAVGLQSAINTDATVFYYPKYLDGTGFDVEVDASSERVGGSGREIGLRYRTKVTADGQYVAYSLPDLAGRAFTHAIGQDTVTAGPSSAALVLWNHQINTGASLLPYLTMEQNWADETERTTNCLISSLKLELEAGKPFKITQQFISGGTPHTQSTQLTPVRESVYFPHLMPGASVAIVANGGLTAGVGATSVEVTKASLEIKNQLDDNIQTTALNREDVLWLNLDIDIDGTFKYINNAFWNAVQYGGGSQVPTGLLTSGAFYAFSPGVSNQSFNILAPFVEFSNLKVNRLDPDGKTMYIDYTASTRGGIGTQSLQITAVTVASTSYTLATT